MNYKCILETFESGEKKHFKTMRDISNYLGVDYHKARGLYIFNTKGKKHIHSITKSLSEKYKIFETPIILIFNRQSFLYIFLSSHVASSIGYPFHFNRYSVEFPFLLLSNILDTI